MELSIGFESAAAYDAHRSEYLTQLVAPMDDMWAAFADMAVPHALLVGEEVVGSCAVDEERRLLRFYVRPRFQELSEALLRRVLGELDVAHVMVFTLDPNYLSTALDLAESVETHSLVFTHFSEPVASGLPRLELGKPHDHERIVAFQARAVGAPLDFLEGYVRERLGRSEMWLYEENGELACVGELRRDAQQDGVAQLGLIVSERERGKGIGTRMLCSLVTQSRDEGLTPVCSTEVGNTGARRAIERAGFRANHRLLRVGFQL